VLLDVGHISKTYLHHKFNVFVDIVISTVTAVSCHAASQQHALQGLQVLLAKHTQIAFIPGRRFLKLQTQKSAAANQGPAVILYSTSRSAVRALNCSKHKLLKFVTGSWHAKTKTLTVGAPAIQMMQSFRAQSFFGMQCETSQQEA
jgi:hypothetical protein